APGVVGDPRPDQVPRDARRDDREDRGLAAGGQEAAVEHQGLARHRDAGALQDHQQEDRQDPVGADAVGDQRDEWSGEIGHGRILAGGASAVARRWYSAPSPERITRTGGTGPGELPG